MILKQKFNIKDLSVNNILILGDTHQYGSATLRLVFDNVSLMYKPYSVANQELLNSVYKILGFDFSIKVFGNQTEFVSEYFSKDDDIWNESVYRSIGSHLAILLYLNTTDCHDDNFIVTNRSVYFIDPETIFQSTISSGEFSNSILSTGFGMIESTPSKPLKVNSKIVKGIVSVKRNMNAFQEGFCYAIEAIFRNDYRLRLVCNQFSSQVVSRRIIKNTSYYENIIQSILNKSDIKTIADIHTHLANIRGLINSESESIVNLCIPKILNKLNLRYQNTLNKQVKVDVNYISLLYLKELYLYEQTKSNIDIWGSSEIYSFIKSFSIPTSNSIQWSWPSIFDGHIFHTEDRSFYSGSIGIMFSMYIKSQSDELKTELSNIFNTLINLECLNVDNFLALHMINKYVMEWEGVDKLIEKLELSGLSFMQYSSHLGLSNGISGYVGPLTQIYKKTSNKSVRKMILDIGEFITIEKIQTIDKVGFFHGLSGLLASIININEIDNLSNVYNGFGEKHVIIDLIEQRINNLIKHGSVGSSWCKGVSGVKVACKFSNTLSHNLKEVIIDQKGNDSISTSSLCCGKLGATLASHFCSSSLSEIDTINSLETAFIFRRFYTPTSLDFGLYTGWGGVLIHKTNSSTAKSVIKDLITFCNY